MNTVFGREPAVIFGLLATLLNALLPLTPWPTNTQGLVGAAVTALAMLAAAAFISVDAALARLTGAVQAVLAAAVALGWHLPDGTQAAILAVITAVGAFFVRTQVTAQQPPAAV